MRLNQVNFTGILPGVLRLAAPILLVLMGAALAAPPARAERIYLDVDTPLAGATVSEPIALCEVRGWAGTGLRGKHDVIIVLDRSGSTFRSSGMDVDGDGSVGHDYTPTMPDEIVTWTSDFGDTIVSAEILAARRLIERLDPETTRMGIVSFGGNAEARRAAGQLARAAPGGARQAAAPERERHLHVRRARGRDRRVPGGAGRGRSARADSARSCS